MLSLANARSEEELRAWETRVRNHLKRLDITASEFSYTTEPKIDGLAITLTYEDGVLVRGATRGDGRVGEDVTRNLRTIGAIPLRIPDPPELVEVRGEIYLPIADFKALNERRAEAGEPTFANPRNSAAGCDPPARPGARRRTAALDLDATGSAPPAASTSPPTWTRSSGCASAASRSTPTPTTTTGSSRSSSAATGGRSAATSSTTRSTASSSRSTSGRCGASSASSAASRAGRSPGSSRRRRRRPKLLRRRLERRPHRPPGPVRDARAGPRRRRHRLDRDPPQRGGPRPQGRQGRRRGRGDAGRRRHPPGRLAADPETPEAHPQGQTAEALPRLQHRDDQARGLGLHDLPQPLRLPGPVLPARQALRQQGGDGHRRARREAGSPLPRRGTDRGRRRHLRARRGDAWSGSTGSARSPPATCWRRSTPPAGGPSNASSTPSGCPASASSPPRRWPTTSARSTPSTPPTRSRSRTSRGSGRSWRCRSPSRSPTSATWELVEKLREKGLRLEQDPSERRAGGRSAGGPDAGPDRDPRGPDPRGGGGADQSGRRQGRQLGLEEDRLRRRRREPGVEAGQGRGAGDRGPRRRPACASWFSSSRRRRRSGPARGGRGRGRGPRSSGSRRSSSGRCG